MQCQGCQTELLATNMPGGRDFRCAVCGFLFGVDSAMAKSAGHQGAWWSLGLGGLSLAAIAAAITQLFVAPSAWLLTYCALAFALGVPAVYFGIRMLLRLRYQRTQNRTMWAAVGGTVLGAVFGIFVGGIFTLFGLMIVVINGTTEIAEGVTASLPASQKLFRIELPAEPHLRPWLVRHSRFVFSNVEYRDQEDPRSSSVCLSVARFPKWATTNRSQISGMLHDEIYDWIPHSNLSAPSSETLKWRIMGADRDVTRIAWRVTEAGESANGAQAIQYFLLFDQGAMSYGIVLAHRPGKSNLEKNDIRSLFESFQPAHEQAR